MKRKKYINIVLVIMLAFSTLGSFAQSSKKLVREGNNKYEDGDFSDAEVQYRKALTKDPNYYKGKFNLGDAMYQQKNYKESGKLFDDLAQRTLDPKAKSGVYYNLGNSLMSEKKYQDAIEAYKNSLRLNPDDQDAKYNLEYAKKKLKDQQQQQQNKDQNKDKNKDKNKLDQQKQEQNKNDQQKDKNKQDQQNQDKQDKQDQQKQNQEQNKQQQGEQKKQQQNQPQQISKADAQKMLEALKNDEKKTLQALQKQKAKAARGKKTTIDW